MNSVSVPRSIRGFTVVLFALLPVLAFIGCGEDDSVAPRKVPNKVLELDGDHDFLSVPIVNHNFATFTIEAKVKVSTYDANVHFVSLYQNVYLVLGDWGQGQICTWAAGLSPIDAGGSGNEPTISTDVWHHFAFSFDGTNQYILIDGVVAFTVPTSGTLTNNSGTFNSGMNIGARYDNSTQYVAGQMDEIRIWNIYRTENQIRDYMNAKISSQTGLVGYWNFDDGTAKDLSGNGADGTLQGDAAIVNK